MSSPYRLVVLSCLLVALVALSPGAVQAKEPPSPEAQYQAKVSTLPAPSAEGGFEFKGQLQLAGAAVGSVQMSAAPHTLPNGAQGWRVTESIEMMQGAFVRKAEALLDAHLGLVSGREMGRQPDKTESAQWERTEAGFQIKAQVVQGEEKTSTEKSVATSGPVLTTMTAVLLFARLTLPAAGDYAVSLFEPTPDDGVTYFEAGTWKLGEKSENPPAWRLLGTKGDDAKLEAQFDLETRDLLLVRLTDEEKGMEMSMVPGAAAPKTDEGLFTDPPASAKQAALQAAMGLATGDLKVVERVIHWPTIYADMKAEHEASDNAEPFPDLDTVKAQLMQAFAGSLPKNPRDQIETILGAMQSTLKVEELGPGKARVEFPPLFKSMKLDVGEFDGVWYLAKLPRG